MGACGVCEALFRSINIICFIVMHYLFHCDVLILFVSLCLCSSQYTHFLQFSRERKCVFQYIYIYILNKVEVGGGQGCNVHTQEN